MLETVVFEGVAENDPAAKVSAPVVVVGAAGAVVEAADDVETGAVVEAADDVATVVEEAALATVC